MLKVEFADISAVEDSLLKYAVIVSRYQGKWIYCKHKERNTWEIPGGRREEGEPILNTAKRELFEESGALDYELTPVCAYCVTSDIIKLRTSLLCRNSFFWTCYRLLKLNLSIFENEPDALTYPHIQPFLLAKIEDWFAEH